ncbi:unnamed protein product [Pleuronectes platessa]|uniref:Uncharacterized protein n=1 Tax=Pleuronectes platessa TaxID=8262 RepID=A0A9N7TPQ2_PLEPL|nr:unnamed protein product [Pleuronectes platessa]
MYRSSPARRGGERRHGSRETRCLGMAELLRLLLRVAEKAANVARVCRQELRCSSSSCKRRREMTRTRSSSRTSRRSPTW